MTNVQWDNQASVTLTADGDDLAETRLNRIETARQLLLQSALSSEEAERRSGSAALTDYFIAYLKLAEPLLLFLTAALPHLETELQQSAFEAQIKDAIHQIADVQAQANRIYSANADLLARKNRLIEESERLAALEAEVNRLTELEQSLSAERLAELAQTAQDLTVRSKILLPQKEKLESDYRRLEAANRELTESIADLEQRRGSEASKSPALAEHLGRILDEAWNQADKRLFEALKRLKLKLKSYEDITGRLATCADQLQELEAAEKNNHELFVRHFAANAGFAEHLQASSASGGEFDPSVQILAGLSEQIGQGLKAHDAELARLMQLRADLVAGVRKLNRTE